MIDVRVDKLDQIEISFETRERLTATMEFAMKDQFRMRSFFGAMNYLLNWGRGDDGQSPTKIIIYRDFTPHSFMFGITTFRYDEEKMAIVENKPFAILMYYRSEDDRWETHS